MISLSPLEKTLLEDLSRRVRIISDELLARHYIEDSVHPLRQARRLTKRLERYEFLVRHRALVSNPFPWIVEPVAIVDPDAEVPDPEKISNASRYRYRDCVTKLTWVYHASNQARALFGGKRLRNGKRPNNPMQADHDLALVAAVAYYRMKRPTLYPSLVGEDCYSRHFEINRDKIPDLMIVNGTDFSNPVAIVEGIARYSGPMVESFLKRWGPESDTPVYCELF